jgi:hypothetical protein
MALRLRYESSTDQKEADTGFENNAPKVFGGSGPVDEDGKQASSRRAQPRQTRNQKGWRRMEEKTPEAEQEKETAVGRPNFGPADREGRNKPRSPSRTVMAAPV